MLRRSYQPPSSVCLARRRVLAYMVFLISKGMTSSWPLQPFTISLLAACIDWLENAPDDDKMRFDPAAFDLAMRQTADFATLYRIVRDESTPVDPTAAITPMLAAQGLVAGGALACMRSVRQAAQEATKRHSNRLQNCERLRRLLDGGVLDLRANRSVLEPVVRDAAQHFEYVPKKKRLRRPQQLERAVRLVGRIGFDLSYPFPEVVLDDHTVIALLGMMTCFDDFTKELFRPSPRK